jgi:hypothetical protein
MTLRALFNLRGTNLWIVALGVAANLLWSFFVMVFGFIYILQAGEGDVDLAYIGLLLAEFLGPFIIGWFCGWLAFDDRGPTYGIYGAMGSVAIILITLLASGLIAILLSFAAIAGGFNGGALSRYRGKQN